MCKNAENEFFVFTLLYVEFGVKKLAYISFVLHTTRQFGVVNSSSLVENSCSEKLQLQMRKTGKCTNDGNALSVVYGSLLRYAHFNSKFNLVKRKQFLSFVNEVEIFIVAKMERRRFAKLPFL